MGISIITVCLNAEKDIEKTLKSVLELEGDNIEYIIKDGGSEDGTTRIVKEYEKYFKQSKKILIYEQKKDFGIYDGMNEAIDIAHNEWICFMNAGDYFFDKDIIKDIFNKEYQGIDLIYGNTVMILHNNSQYMYLNNHNQLVEGRSLNQQACFYRKELFHERKFNASYKSLGDYEYFLYLIKNKKEMKKIDRTIAVYNTFGVSSMNRVLNAEEYEKISMCYPEIKKRKRLSFIRKIIKNIKMKFYQKYPFFSDFSICWNAIKSDKV